MKLKKRLNQAANKLSETGKNFQSAQTRELLPEAEPENFVLPSIIENTTKRLSEKIKR